MEADDEASCNQSDGFQPEDQETPVSNVSGGCSSSSERVPTGSPMPASRGLPKPKVKSSRYELLCESALIALGHAGDGSALNELCLRKREELLPVAMRITHYNKEDAEDLVQVTLLRMVMYLHTFKGKDGFWTWLVRIMTNESITRQKRTKQTVLLTEQVENKVLTDSAKHLPAEVNKIALDIEVENLPEIEQLIFNLIDKDEYSYEEVAQIVNRTTNEVSSRIRHARQTLKKRLRPNND